MTKNDDRFEPHAKALAAVAHIDYGREWYRDPPKLPEGFHYVTTNPSPFSRKTGVDCGQRGWRLHILIAEGKETAEQIGRRPALCNLRPAWSWGLDMFVDTPCKRCLRRLAQAVAEAVAQK